ncbi:hypothetical protein Hanom_Chr02g00176321 [Helianthus anomalus]
MKKYNVKQSWELLRRNSNMNCIHYLRRPKNRMLNDSFFHLDESLFFCGTLYVDAPIFVQSLVSPHVNGRPM